MASESVPSQEHQLFEAHEFHERALAQRVRKQEVLAQQEEEALQVQALQVWVVQSLLEAEEEVGAWVEQVLQVLVEWVLRAAAVAALAGPLRISLYTRNVCFLYQYSTNNHLPSLHFYTAYR